MFLWQMEAKQNVGYLIISDQTAHGDQSEGLLIRCRPFKELLNVLILYYLENFEIYKSNEQNLSPVLNCSVKIIPYMFTTCTEYVT